MTAKEKAGLWNLLIFAVTVLLLIGHAILAVINWQMAPGQMNSTGLAARNRDPQPALRDIGYVTAVVYFLIGFAGIALSLTKRKILALAIPSLGLIIGIAVTAILYFLTW